MTQRSATSVALILGFTGTRHGMTEEQIRAADFESWEFGELHHGDCVGADTDMHRIARANGLVIAGHPPSDPRLRAYNDCDLLFPEKPYHDRNRDIVDACDVLLATPAEDEEQEKGGTWYTVRYAREVGKRLSIIWPSGKVERSGDLP